MRIVNLRKLAVARLAEQAANLTEAEAHAANDLALYTVNTAALYHAFRPQLEYMAKQTKAGRPPSHRPWIAHAQAGRRAYQAELKTDALHAVASWRQDAVLSAAAMQIADHYDEELGDILGRA
jgi:hypothetical protein